MATVNGTSDNTPATSAALNPDHVGSVPPLFAKVGYIIVFSLGFFGNGMIIKVYTRSRALRNPVNVFIINLAIADLGFLFSGCTSLNTLMNDGRMLYGETGCFIIALFVITSASGSLITMGMIAITRYIAIVRPQLKRFLSWRSCACACVAIWVYGALLMVPALTGWGRLGYQPAAWVCAFDWSYNLAYNILIFCGSQVLTSCVMVFCYVNIFWVFHQSKKRVAGAGRAKGPKKEEIRLALQLLVVFGIYNACWGPYFLVSLIIDPEGQLSTNLYGVIAIPVFINSSVNALVYVYYNKVFRAECLKTFGIKYCDSVTSSEQSSTRVTALNDP